MIDEVKRIVLSYPKLSERIKNNPHEEEKAVKNLEEIRADWSRTTISTFAKILDAAIAKLYDGINLKMEEGFDFKGLVANNNVVLVPNHQSHADYIAINYALYKEYKIPLYVAGGINLNIFPIGSLFRRSGCFFIRRSFNNDVLYRLTLEAYLYYLLYTGKLVEFFFEGGRSRSGKLLPPKYGLYQMLIEAHRAIPDDVKRPLYFVPVSINHEYVPEQKTLVKEMEGAKKKKEHPTQLLKLINLLKYQMGTVHISMSKPIVATFSEDLKVMTQRLAFDCFREVGRKMLVTPSSLLSFVMLDDPAAAMKWEDILTKGRHILKYCETFHVPVSDSLQGDQYEEKLKRSVEMFVNNGKIERLGRKDHIFYAIKENSRAEMLYFKNTILHHFIVPGILARGWTRYFNAEFNNADQIKFFLLAERLKLKHEFYLPTVKDFLQNSLKVVSNSIGRELKTLDELAALDRKDLYQLAFDLGAFSRSFTFLNEAYYLTTCTIENITSAHRSEFTMDVFDKYIQQTYKEEIAKKHIIRYKESYSKALVKSSIQFLETEKIIASEGGKYRVVDREKLSTLVDNLVTDLTQKMMVQVIGG